MEFLQENVSLKNCSTLRLDATARYFCDVRMPEDVERLPEVFDFLAKEKLPYFFLGGGSNVIFAFDEYPGCVIRMSLRGWSLDGDGLLTVMAGEPVTPLAAALAKERSLPIFDRWLGLPGTVGGGVVGNAGCFGLEMARYFVSARVYDLRTKAYETWDRDMMRFEYRSSALKGDADRLIVSVAFDCSVDLDQDRYRDGVEFRQLKQPKGFTCGSFFKNPTPRYAGQLIDEAGLKGTRIGGAEISALHGNFFLNIDHASWRDLLALRDLAQTTVREKFGIELVPEVRIVEPPEMN